MDQNKKIKVGIDINEVLRARWVQFDKYYVEEFGEEAAPSGGSYVYDLFNGYNWNDSIEETQYLKEDFPDNINPLDYQVDKKTGKAPIDHLAFKTEKQKLTAKEVFNRFMYEDYVLEIHGSAPFMYKQMDLHVEKFYLKYCEHVDFVLLSQENWFTIPPTLFFLSKMMSRFKEYRFVEEKKEMWKDIDILITTDPELLDNNIPKDKKVIKLERPYNKESQVGEIENILQINDLNDNKDFEKIINYKKK